MVQFLVGLIRPLLSKWQFWLVTGALAVGFLVWGQIGGKIVSRRLGIPQAITQIDRSLDTLDRAEKAHSANTLITDQQTKQIEQLQKEAAEANARAAVAEAQANQTSDEVTRLAKRVADLTAQLKQFKPIATVEDAASLLNALGY